MEVILAKNYGFCFGVKRAVELLEKALEDNKTVYTFGPLIHNQQFVDKMAEKGAKIANKLEDVEEQSIVISRAHGLEKEIIEGLKNKNVTIIDGVCPFVNLVHKKALELESDGFQIIIIGEKDHPEVKAAASYVKNPIIIENPVQVKDFELSNKIGIVVQTTQSQQNVNDIVSALIENIKDVRIFNTRCSATEERQNAAVELAKIVDKMVIIGGKHSGNTKRLYQLCSEVKPSIHIETANELKKDEFQNINKVGITAGASTPQYIIDEVIETLNTF